MDMDKIDRSKKETFIRNKRKSVLLRTTLFLVTCAVLLALGYFLADFISSLIVEMTGSY